MAETKWLRGTGKTAHAYQSTGRPLCQRDLTPYGTISAATGPRCKACIKKVRAACGTEGRA